MVALVKKNVIWAAGGIVKQKNQHIIEITDSIEEYNVQLDVWQYIGQLRMPRFVVIRTRHLNADFSCVSDAMANFVASNFQS